MASLTGKTIIVTGGAGALGAGVVSTLLADGAQVVIADRNEALARATAGTVTVGVDLLDEESVLGMAKEALAISGRIDGLVALAGGFFGDTPLVDTPVDALRQQLELNVVTAFTAIQAVLPHMIRAESGSIVAVSSRPALRPVAGTVAYGAAKLAVAKMIASVDEECRMSGVRANAIAPSVIDTPANRRSMPNADFTRWVQPAAIGGVIRFLMSDESLPVSGAVIPVYGRA